MDLEPSLWMPATVVEEIVVWCQPGVMAKLMELYSVPVPVRRARRDGIGGGRRNTSGAPPVARVGGGGVKKKRPRRIVGKEEAPFTGNPASWWQWRYINEYPTAVS